MSNYSESPLERIKQIDAEGQEYWLARDLMTVLDYTKWQSFRQVMLNAETACANSGYDASQHFATMRTMRWISPDAKREVEDCRLSRLACYLIVQNADPAKEAVALAQTYMVMQSRRQEIADRKKLDQMTNAELAANIFRTTQVEEKLRRENIQGRENANQVHLEAGVIVRRAIEEMVGTMPEDLPTVESIKKLERSEKKRLTAKNKKDSDE